VFVYTPEALERVKQALSPGNDWARRASLIIAVCGKKESDCIMKDGREYFLFDTGMATGMLLLRATELGLVAHPIAGYDPQAVKAALNVPEDISVVTLVIVGKHAETINSALNLLQAEAEKDRPPRLALEHMAFHNEYPKAATP